MRIAKLQNRKPLASLRIPLQDTPRIFDGIVWPRLGKIIEIGIIPHCAVYIRLCVCHSNDARENTAEEVFSAIHPRHLTLG